MKRLTFFLLLICIALVPFYGKNTKRKKKFKPPRVKRVIDKPENKEIGCLYGTIKIYLSDPFISLQKGYYLNNILLTFKDKNEKGRNWTPINVRVVDGVYYVENLPPGEYELVRFRFEEEVADVVTTITGDFENIAVSIYPGTITTLDDIIAKPKRIKRSFAKYTVVYDYKEENVELMKQYFFSKVDRDGYWADFAWQQHRDMKTIPNLAESKMEMIHNIVLAVEADFETVKRFFNNQDYQLSVVLGHRILKDLLKAYFIYSYDKDSINEDEIPETEDLKLLAEMANLELDLDQVLFLADVTTYSEKIKNKSLTDDEERYLFSEKFTKNYIEHIKKLKDYIVEKTDTQTEVEKTKATN